MHKTPYIKSLLSYKHNHELNPGLSLAEIESFEQKNNTTLPEPLKELYLHFDGGELFIPGTTVYSLYSPDSGYSLIEENTPDVRQYICIPDTYLIFASYCWGDRVCINTSAPYDVVEWDHETNEISYSWDGLDSFLLYEIERFEDYIAEDLKSVVSKLKEQGKSVFIDGATKKQIEAFEAKNNISLPAELKKWLCFSDGGDLFLPAGIQLHGVTHNPLIDVNDNDKPSNDYIVIGTLASGDPILCQKERTQISIYNREAGRIEITEIYSDFFSLLDDFLDSLKSADD